MRCLWLTLADPDPPLNGQFLYARGLIRSAAAAGMDLDVVGFSLPGGQHRDNQLEGTVRWHLAAHQPRSHWTQLWSLLPRDVNRTKTSGLRRIVRGLLAAGAGDVVVFDSIGLAWALAPLRASITERSPVLVYIAYNHEENLARKILGEERHPVKRLLRRLDAIKFAKLERALVRQADLVTGITPDDCAEFRSQWPEKRIEYLPPGYSGSVATRPITADLPRRAVIIGSFDWITKRQSLQDFLAAANPLFGRAGIALDVVGRAEEAYLQEMRRQFPAVRFTGPVDDVAVYMSEARLAVVPDRMPGFKLKGLDYVFNRLPIFALQDSLPGMPLADGESARFFSEYESLSAAITRSIDDLDTLNGLQERAYRACADQFDWRAIGQRLVNAIVTCRSRALAASEPMRTASAAPPA
jgi:polysaccharide biosynthesis protein PslH